MQLRARPLAEMLAAAKAVAREAGVTRLADVTGLDTLGFPIFQAIRPYSLSLSTAMGRGPTRRAAMISALMEAIETNACERVRPLGAPRTLASLGEAALELWNRAPRDSLAIRLDPELPRHWMEGDPIGGGQSQPVPFDLVSHDLTRPAYPDALRITVGLASGGDREDALASAIAEALEHDLEADWRRASPDERRATEINSDSVDDPPVRAAVSRILAAGCQPILWSLGQDFGTACFLCLIIDARGSATSLPPVCGAGCHPNRTVAALRALLEAAQARAAMISGARDDLTARAYGDRALCQIELQLATLSFGVGPLAWQAVPTVPNSGPRRTLEALLEVARRRSTLPLLVVPLTSPHPAIKVLKVIAPGLRIPDRAGIASRRDPAYLAAGTRTQSRRRVIFSGPTLWDAALPDELERRPPARAGDLAALLADPPEAIGLIDGCFETSPSVWHKEVLELMARGVIVFGAASLGALRAAELAEFGMRGIGEVFAAYRCGTIMRDDAVMVLHAPEELDYRPITISLVDVEATLARIPLSQDGRRMLQRIARTMPFRTRTWRFILARYHRRTGRRPEVSLEQLENAPSVKKQDALLLVEALSGSLPPAIMCPRPPLTTHYRRLLESGSPTRP